MSLECVVEALKKLTVTNDDELTSSSEHSRSPDSADSDDSNDSIYHKSRQRGKKKYDQRRFFCYEDAFSAKDISMEVSGIGNLQFPLTEDSIHKLIEISSKAKFGSGEKTLLDYKIRDTQAIPADKLKVSIDEKSFASVLDRISSGLNISQDSNIELHLHNLLIYGTGQFFKKHRDSEKFPNMVATFVIVLPSVHKGGDLIIEHDQKEHVFFGSQNFDIIKCVAFYSDCQHEIKKVTEGYRVALTYNVVLKSPGIVKSVSVNKLLDKAVLKYFTSGHRETLVFLLNHHYSEHSLKWNMLKGVDYTYGHALFAVAKKQNRLPYLALANCVETRCSEIYDDGGDLDEEYGSSIDLYYWINEYNVGSSIDKYSPRFSKTLSEFHVSESEVCFTVETNKLHSPFKKEESGPTGNEGATCDYWYHRACVVIFRNKWVILKQFRYNIRELYELTTEPNNENDIIEKISEAGRDFIRYDYWQDPTISEMLIKIVIYLKNPSKAVLILSALSKQLLAIDRINLLLVLETLFDDETWKKITQNWKDGKNMVEASGRSYVYSRFYRGKRQLSEILGNAIQFLKSYKAVSKSRVVLEFLLTVIIEDFVVRSDNSTKFIYSRIESDTVAELCTLLKICVEADYQAGLKKLTELVRSSYPVISQAEVLIWLYDNLDCDSFSYFKGLRVETLNVLEKNLTKFLGNDDWSLLFKISCNCEFCSKVNNFLVSKTETKFIFPTVKKNRAHVYSYLEKFRDQPIVFQTLRVGSPFKIVIEKQERMKSDYKKLMEVLKDFQRKLTKLVFSVPKETQALSVNVFYNSKGCRRKCGEGSVTTKTETSSSCEENSSLECQQKSIVESNSCNDSNMEIKNEAETDKEIPAKRKKLSLL